MITLENRFFPVRSAVCFFVEGGIILVSVIASFFLVHESGNVESIALKDAIWWELRRPTIGLTACSRPAPRDVRIRSD